MIGAEYSPLCLPSLVPMILAAPAGEVASISFSASSSDENSNMPPPTPTPPRLRSALEDLAKSSSCRAIRAPNAGSLGEREQGRVYIKLYINYVHSLWSIRDAWILRPEASLIFSQSFDSFCPFFFFKKYCHPLFFDDFYSHPLVWHNFDSVHP